MFDSQIRSLEERVTRAAPSEVGCCEANPSELTFHEVKEFARATFASEDGRKIKQIYPLMSLGISSWVSKLGVMAPPFEPTMRQ